MTDERAVLMDAEQADLLNELTERLIRENDPRAMKLGSLAIAYKFAKPVEPDLPDNVVPLDPWSRKVGA
jgi:hypothetical protein